MKNLKLGLFSLLAILAVSVFLTSCEQEIVENIHDEATKDFQLLVDKIEAEATYKNELVLNDEESGVTVTFDISTNIPAILDSYNAENVKLNLDKADVESAVEDRRYIETDVDDNYMPIDLNRNIVEVKLRSITSTTQIDDIPVISLRFNDSFRRALKENNAGVLYTFQNAETEAFAEGAIQSRGKWHWPRYRSRSVKMTSDGRGDFFNKAHVNVHYLKNGNPTGLRSGSFYNCLTSRTTNLQHIHNCYDAYIYGVYSWGDFVATDFYSGCDASC